MRRAGGALAAAALLLAAPARAGDLDLLGTWYVLVHYKDSQTSNPDFERWEDRIWVFQTEGSRLRWTQYPIVVFDDDSGRFERTGRQYARVLHYWEPNPGQLAEIRGGLEINERGSKSKALRGSDGEGWASAAPIQAFSASTLTYTETWRIEHPRGLPVFTIEESLGGARAESLEGSTEYRTATVESGGSLRGTYNRDGARVGTFRMLRAGAVSEVAGSKDQAAMRARLQGGSATGAEGLAEMLRDPKVRPVDVERVILGRLQDAGEDPREWHEGVRGLAERIFAERAKGTSPEEIERMVREGEITLSDDASR